MDFKLKSLCLENNISCLQLEKFLNIHNARLSKYCQQTFFPNIDRAICLANYFNCSLDYLVGLTNIKISENLSTPNIQIFFQRINDLIAIEKNKTVFLNNCKLARTTLFRWKQKNIFPRLENIYNIASYYNISIDYLLGRTNVKEIKYDK